MVNGVQNILHIIANNVMDGIYTPRTGTSSVVTNNTQEVVEDEENSALFYTPI